MLDLSGSSCGCIGDWRMFRCFLESLPEARLTRVDVAVDCLNGEYTVDQAVQWVQDGAFNCRGREPGTRMDSVFNMKAPLHFFVCIVLACAGTFARAEAPQTMYQIRPSSQIVYPSDLFTTPEAACEVVGPVWKGSPLYYGNYGPPYWWDSSSCRATPKTPAYHWDFVKLDEVWGCSNGSAPDYSKPWEERCDASAPPEPTCEPYRQSTVTVSAGFKIPGTNTTTDMKAPTNIDGCRVLAGEVIDCASNVATGEVFCTWRVTETGGSAGDGDDPDSVSPIPEESKPEDVPVHNPALGQGCPKGTVNIGTDSTGGSICAGKGTSPQTPPKKEVKEAPTTTTNDDGSTTKTEVTHTTNADGSVTTKTKTTRTDANGRVTTDESSVTGPVPGTGGGGGSGGGGTGGGSGGTPGQSDADKNDLCAKNPNLNICRNSSVSGECDNTSCEGDAITCAMLRQQRKVYCELTKPDERSILGGQMMSGNDPLKSEFPTKENARVVDVPQLNKNAFLNGGACFGDVSFSVSGHQFTLPVSKLCDYLIGLRGLIMLLASLASWRLVSRSVLG